MKQDSKMTWIQEAQAAADEMGLPPGYHLNSMSYPQIAALIARWKRAKRLKKENS